MRKFRAILFMALVLSACATRPSKEQPSEPAPPPPQEQPSEPAPPLREQPPESNKVPFSISTRRIIQESQLELIQYYLSTNITLTRSQDKSMVRVNSAGELVQTTGREVSEIYIAKETPGELLDAGFLDTDGDGVYTEYLGICFDDNTSNILRFVPREDKNHYELLLNNKNGVKTIMYNELEYAISYEGDLPTLLIVNASKSGDTVERKDLKGRLVVF